MVTQGQIINVQAYKQDGTLYRQWNGLKIISIRQDGMILLMYKTKVVEKAGQKWITTEPAFWWFPSNSNYHNTISTIRDDGIYHYTNLAGPPIIEEGTLKFIDYDLDIKAYPRKKMKIVDRKEFTDNSEKYGYSKFIKNKVEQTAKHLMETGKQPKNIYDDHKIVSWLKKSIKDNFVPRKFLHSKLIEKKEA